MNKPVIAARWLGYTSIVWLTGLIVVWFRPHDQIGWVCTIGFSAFLAFTVTLVTFTQARSDIARRAEARRPASPPLSIFERSEATFVVNPEVGSAGLSGFTATALRK